MQVADWHNTMLKDEQYVLANAALSVWLAGDSASYPPKMGNIRALLEAMKEKIRQLHIKAAADNEPLPDVFTWCGQIINLDGYAYASAILNHRDEVEKLIRQRRQKAQKRLPPVEVRQTEGYKAFMNTGLELGFINEREAQKYQ